MKNILQEISDISHFQLSRPQTQIFAYKNLVNLQDR